MAQRVRHACPVPLTSPTPSFPVASGGSGGRVRTRAAQTAKLRAFPHSAPRMPAAATSTAPTIGPTVPWKVSASPIHELARSRSWDGTSAGTARGRRGRTGSRTPRRRQQGDEHRKGRHGRPHGPVEQGLGDRGHGHQPALVDPVGQGAGQQAEQGGEGAGQQQGGDADAPALGLLGVEDEGDQGGAIAEVEIAFAAHSRANSGSRRRNHRWSSGSGPRSSGMGRQASPGAPRPVWDNRHPCHDPRSG